MLLRERGVEIAEVEKIERVVRTTETPVYERGTVAHVIPTKKLVRVDVTETPTGSSVVTLKRSDGSRFVDSIDMATPPFAPGQKVLLLKDGPWQLIYFRDRDATSSDLDRYGGCI